MPHCTGMGYGMPQTLAAMRERAVVPERPPAL
jgi:hypothetical protein